MPPRVSSKQKPISLGAGTPNKAFHGLFIAKRSTAPRHRQPDSAWKLFRRRCKPPHSIPWQRIPSSDQDMESELMICHSIISSQYFVYGVYTWLISPPSKSAERCADKKGGDINQKHSPLSYNPSRFYRIVHLIFYICFLLFFVFLFCHFDISQFDYFIYSYCIFGSIAPYVAP